MYLQSSSPQDFKVKRTSIVRRWAAENFITRRDGLDAVDEAERCFDALVVRGLIRPVDIGAAVKVIGCSSLRGGGGELGTNKNLDLWLQLVCTKLKLKHAI